MPEKRCVETRGESFQWWIAEIGHFEYRKVKATCGGLLNFLL